MRNRVYCDYAATTPLDPRVFKAMRPYFERAFGNPGSLHSFGQETIRVVDLSRETIARALGRPAGTGFREIVFTGSATEANNLALRGVQRALSFKLLGFSNSASSLTANSYKLKPRIIISSIEHESILETAKDLENEGVEVVIIPVTKEGIVDLKKLKAALNERTILVSVMYVNNEIGTIQPITEIAKIIEEFRIQNLEFREKQGSKTIPPKSYILNPKFYPIFHTDASQAFQFLDCNPDTLGVDLMTLSAHKIYGPKGVGALYIRNGSLIAPLITGGGQEFGFRSGTENVPGIVGFAKAVELIGEKKEFHAKRIADLRDYLWKSIKKIYPKAQLNPPLATRSHIPATHFIPHILNVYFPGHSAEDLLTALDLQGIAVSSGSACRARSLEPSRVIEALPLRSSKERARASLRFSFGRPTTKAELDYALTAIKKLVQ